ncbi:MAG: HDOD domain-containing protein [Alphaproteobacteria bacterium]|uniref:HDOD domain-containing protein n=1 Tax=Candidatus Nitrobium versatile TaxID=2884831 RepID=A0A953M0H5_9BACT|nr:HDOD domain-containing protein [Candidatus Nitrobium versatile]
MKGRLFQKIMLDDIEVPGMPDIAVKVLSLLEDEYCSMRKLEAVIFEDPSLTTAILKVANAPFYKTGKSINTLPEAIMAIGLHNLLALVSIISLTNQLSGKHFDTALMRHAMAVSSAAALLAQEGRGVKKEEALVAGLLHDIGKTILSCNAPEQYTVIRDRSVKEKRPFIEIEDEVLGFNHCTIGSVLAKKWKFPALYEHIIRTHHGESVKSPAGPEQVLSCEERLCYVVRIADTLTLAAGIGVGEPSEKRLGDLLRVLGIDAETYIGIKRKVAAAGF